MKIREIRKKSEVERAKLLEELKKKTREVRFQISSRETKNNQLLRQLRKDIARILTITNEQSKDAEKHGTN